MNASTVAVTFGATVSLLLGGFLLMVAVVTEYEERTRQLPPGYRQVAFSDVLVAVLFSGTLIALGISLVVEFLV